MLRETGRALCFVGLRSHTRLQRALEEARARTPSLQYASFDELDLALEWCEEGLLGGAGAAAAEEIPLAQHEALAGFAEADIALLGDLLERRQLGVRELAVRKGDPAHELYLVVRGRLSVLAEDAQGGLRRLATLSPGMCFGEAALLEDATRSASVRADQPAVCYALSRAAARGLAQTRPELALRLLENLLRSSARTVARLSSERLAGETLA